MATLTERAKVQAAEIHPGQWLLAVFIGFFWCIGWVAGMLVRALAFIGAGIRLGWQDARVSSRGPAR